MTVCHVLSALLVAGVLTTQLAAQTVVSGSIPSNAAIVFHYLNQIYVMTRDGQRTRLTVDTTRTYEHVAVSPDRLFLVANYFATNGTVHLSMLILYDLTAPHGANAGAGVCAGGQRRRRLGPPGADLLRGIHVMPFPTPTTEAH